jgi:hypothetical protein
MFRRSNIFHDPLKGNALFHFFGNNCAYASSPKDISLRFFSLLLGVKLHVF